MDYSVWDFETVGVPATHLESAKEIKKSQLNSLRIHSSAPIAIYREIDQMIINK